MNAILDLDSILDSSLDNVADLPDYQNPPAGIYMLSISDAQIEQYTAKAKGDKPAEEKVRIKLTYKVDATIETEDLPVADGTLFTENFMATEQGLGFFKKQAKRILNVEDMTGASIRDTLDTLKGASFKAKIKIKVYGEFENVQVQPIHEG